MLSGYRGGLSGNRQRDDARWTEGERSIRMVDRLLGVYNADGGLVGELRYIVGHLLGTTSCALCDITHSPIRRKREWDALVAELGIRVDLRHLNELDERERAAVGDRAPVVLVERDGVLSPPARRRPADRPRRLGRGVRNGRARGARGPRARGRRQSRACARAVSSRLRVGTPVARSTSRSSAP